MMQGYWWGMHAKQRRKQLGMTQQLVADAIGVTRAEYAMMENRELGEKPRASSHKRRERAEIALRFSEPHAVEWSDGVFYWLATWQDGALRDIEEGWRDGIGYTRFYSGSSMVETHRFVAGAAYWHPLK